jgi:hypothetical protein
MVRLALPACLPACPTAPVSAWSCMTCSAHELIKAESYSIIRNITTSFLS